MINGIEELNEEQLADVTGGSINILGINQHINSFAAGANFVNSPTTVFAIGGGRNSSVTALAQGATSNVGNTIVSLNTING